MAIYFLPISGITVKVELSVAAVYLHVQHQAQPGLWHSQHFVPLSVDE